MTATFLLALCSALASEDQAKVETLRGAHFEVTAHFDARKLAEEALVAAEAVVSSLESVFGKVEIERKGAVVIGPRMPIHLFWSPAEFAQAAADHLSVPAAGGHAFTSDKAEVACVLIVPPSVSNALSATGLPLHTKLDVAREAAHLWARRASPLATRWPYWFLEGGSAWAAEEACRSKQWIQSYIEYPEAASRILRTQMLLAGNALPNLFAFVDGFPSGLTADERRAVASQLFRFLEDPANAEIMDTVAYAARVTKQDDVPAAVARVMRSKIGDTAAQSAFEGAFDAWLRAQRPAWEELHGSLWPVGDTWIQAADAANALAWRADVAPDDQYEISGETALFPAERRQANLLLARGQHTFLEVAFVADHGVDVLQFDARRPEAERWKTLTSAPLEAVKEGRFMPFRIVADKSALEVWVDGKPVLSLADTGTTLAGAWGLGSFSGSCCAWRNLGFKDLP